MFGERFAICDAVLLVLFLFYSILERYYFFFLFQLYWGFQCSVHKQHACNFRIVLYTSALTMKIYLLYCDRIVLHFVISFYNI